MKTATVQLNGKTYDAISGVMISDIRPPAAVAKTATVKKAAAKTVVSKPVHVETPSTSSRIHVHAIAKHARGQTQQPSITLMRKAVRKPAPGLKKALNIQAPLAKQAVNVIVEKVAVSSVDTSRQERAKQTEKHTSIQHYGQSTATIRAAHVPVKNAPEDPEPEEVAAPAPKPSNGLDELFERAMENATHFVDVTTSKTHFKKKVRMHVASMSAGTLALLLVIGFAAYQNSPGLQLRVAGFQTGVSTANPNFAASGFAYNGVTAKDGKRIIGLKSNTGEYQLSQQSTNWSGQEMIQQVSSVSASGDPNFTTVTGGGRTIYRFSGNQATWVKHGVWYQVSGTKSLSDSQLESLAQNS